VRKRRLSYVARRRHDESQAEQYASANAGWPLRLHSAAIGPAWLRFAFGCVTRMKTIFKAVCWSIGAEAAACLLVPAGNIPGCGFLAYFALMLHLPAMMIVSDWPAARATLIAPIFFQWLMWFVLFALAILLRHRFYKTEASA